MNILTVGKEGGIGRGEGKMLKMKHNGLKLLARRNTQRKEHWHFVKARRRKSRCKGMTTGEWKEEEDHKRRSCPPRSSKHIHKGANKLLSICFLIITPISYVVLPSLRSMSWDWQRAAAAAPTQACVFSKRFFKCLSHACPDRQTPAGLQLGDGNAAC